MKVYAGGPIDYSTVHSRLPHVLIDWLAFKGIEVYCPQCENEDETDIIKILQKNGHALLAADRAVFLLDGPTVGTPIEIELRLKECGPSSMAIVHPGRPGLYVQMWDTLGVSIFKTIPEAAAWLAE